MDSPPNKFQGFNPIGALKISRQELPHWQQSGATYFVTFRLVDSLPRHLLNQWKDEICSWLTLHPEPWDWGTWLSYLDLFEKKQAWLDAGYGECLLADERIRQIVENGFLHFDGSRYILDEFIIMPNHVHVLVKPLSGQDLSKILHSWKSFTAKKINQQLERQNPIWMDESFDHIVRSWNQLLNFRQYIETNPTKVPNLQITSNRGSTPLIQ